jgi:hypothetical protein
MRKFIPIALLAVFTVACEPSSDSIQQQQQERILREGTAALGMPSIKNFREKRLLKDILELRDQEGLITYTYVFSEQTGQLKFFCNSIGYGIPYATQYTNPLKVEGGPAVIAQADPNGLFSPASAEGTWIMCADPTSKDKRGLPVYVEPRVIVSPFKLSN